MERTESMIAKDSLNIVCFVLNFNILSAKLNSFWETYYYYLYINYPVANFSPRYIHTLVIMWILLIMLVFFYLFICYYK